MKNLLIITLIISTFSAFAQEIPTEKKKTQHRIGVHAGTASGAGLSYKAIMNNKYEFQLTTLPFASEDNKVLYSGLNLFYKFVDTKKFDILCGVSLAHLYSYNTNSYYNYDTTGTSILVTGTPTETNTYNSSFGFGFEVGGSDIFKFNFQLGYGVYNMFTKDWMTLPSVGVGIDFLLSKRG